MRTKMQHLVIVGAYDNMTKAPLLNRKAQGLVGVRQYQTYQRRALAGPFDNTNFRIIV